MTDRVDHASEQISFGPFRFLPAQHLLLQGEGEVRLGGRARDILLTLLERPGEIVGKQELIARAWPGTFVDEANLRVHVAALRKALGDGQHGRTYIKNIQGRGYSFVERVSVQTGAISGAISAATPDPRPAAAQELSPELPPVNARMVGRAGSVEAIAAQAMLHRLVTITGPGGIGKTTVSLAVAEALQARFRDGARFVDLASLTDPMLAPTALASALGAPVFSDQPLRGLVSLLRDMRMLIVLDNCEHVIDAAATLADEVLRGAPGVHILTTSREPLGIAGERVNRLAPLATPPATEGLTAADAMTFSAVELFVERAAARLGGFELGDADAVAVANICRRLDGIPLAVEIVAGRVDAFGVATLATLLDDRFRLLMRGGRTALPRHQTLSTTLDWSYRLLPECERVVLRRLAVFAGVFTLSSAVAVLGEHGLSSQEVIEGVGSLVSKSLVAAMMDGVSAEYRLLDTTRAYAATKLEAAGEAPWLMRRHAECFLAMLEASDEAWQRLPAADWIEERRHLIADLRTALAWSFAPAGDRAIGVALAVAAVPLWFQLSLINECQERVQQALAALLPGSSPGDEMRLHSALAWSLMQTRGSVSETQASWLRTLQLAEALGDVDHLLRALWGLWAGRLNGGDPEAALALARRFYDAAGRQADPSDLFVGDRMIGYSLHLLGRQSEARRHVERMLGGYVVPVTGAQIIRFVFDQRAMARCFLARILWLQGFPDQAMRLVDEIVEHAVASRDALSLCQALVQAACPIALLVGDMAAAGRFTAMLLECATGNALDFWQVWGRCFDGAACIARGEVATGLQRLGTGLGQLRNIGFGVYYIPLLGEFAEALGEAGKVSEGLAAIDEALERSERHSERWCVAELLRIKGALLLAVATPEAAAAADAHFAKSLDWARRQEVWSWELRTAISAGRLWKGQGRTEDASALLRSAYGRFSEGHATNDLLAAKSLLDALG